jgi:hypothetical protein
MQKVFHKKMIIVLIVNPYRGGSKTNKLIPKVEDQLKAHRIDSDLFTIPTEIKNLTRIGEVFYLKMVFSAFFKVAFLGELPGTPGNSKKERTRASGKN